MASGLLGYAGGGADAAQSSICYINFTQDLSCLTVATKSGYRFYSLNSVESLEKIFSCDDDGELLLVERLFSSSLLALVVSRIPHKLRLYHYKKGTEICSYTYTGKILAVRLNRQRLVVCLEDSLYIHNIRDMKVMHTIKDTPPNVCGLFALATPSVANERQSYLAYPGSNQSGLLHVFDTINLRAVNTIKAHNNPLVAVTFNSQGDLIATASEKGTVIRVFNVESCERLYEFRRGVKRCADIYSLSFSLDSTYLCCSSNTETVHVFKLQIVKESKQSGEGQGWYGYLGQALKSSTSYLPSTVSDVLTQGRYFAVARLPAAGVRNICAVCNIEKTSRLLVATLDGLLYVYNLDPQDGGECFLLTQHRIDDSVNSVNPVANFELSEMLLPSSAEVNSETEETSRSGNTASKTTTSANGAGDASTGSCSGKDDGSNISSSGSSSSSRKTCDSSTGDSGSSLCNSNNSCGDHQASSCGSAEGSSGVASNTAHSSCGTGGSTCGPVGNSCGPESSSCGPADSSYGPVDSSCGTADSSCSTAVEVRLDGTLAAGSELPSSSASSSSSRCKARKSSNTSSSSSGSDSGLQWADCASRKSYASVVQTVGGAVRSGPQDDVQDELCTALQDLEEAAQFEDALSDDTYSSPDDSSYDSALKITDSAEFPCMSHTRKS